MSNQLSNMVFGFGKDEKIVLKVCKFGSEKFAGIPWQSTLEQIHDVK